MLFCVVVEKSIDSMFDLFQVVFVRSTCTFVEIVERQSIAAVAVLFRVTVCRAYFYRCEYGAARQLIAAVV